ncbi:MAG TPA: CoA protein activase [Firmicutes bacterium]|jgi:predicted nucleotide-binding protein (sugar kinase/HSP70/actin superfamily)|nr:CoA protein activase [Bacillota bacterium]HOQ24259.1 acyl-CoA dehydratase activase-related protein [Bacillota bacterium]HPT66467.1 acyl-CoA dehydratase activase-related protein [Bacillota bacterium]
MSPRYKVTMPRMGTASLALKTFLTELGFDVVLPPPITRETLALGGRYTPEFACLPLKVNLGNYLQTLPQAPDAIFMAGGIGPCRFGLYGEVQREILKSLGYDIPLIVFEPPKKHAFELIDCFTRFLGHRFWLNLPGAARITWEKFTAIDRVDKAVLARSALLDQENRKTLWKQRKAFLQRLDGLMDLGGIRRLVKETEEGILMLSPEAERPSLRVMLVGEIYVVLEPGINFDLEKNLAMLGVEVHRTIYFSEWIWQQLFLNFLRIDWQRQLRQEARPYLRRFVGGHGLETVAHTVQAAREGYDGVVQLAPLGCMPEVVAMSIIQRVSREQKIPVLSILLDEHSAGTGVQTRLEAFVDLLQNKRIKAAI